MPLNVKRFIEIAEALGIPLWVINYDKCSRNLTGHFSRWLDLKASSNISCEYQFVNRGLNYFEIETQRIFNSHLGKKARHIIADAFRDQDTTQSPGPRYPIVSQAALLSFLKRMSDQIDLVNPLLRPHNQYELKTFDDAIKLLKHEEDVAEGKVVLSYSQLNAIAHSLKKFVR